MILDVTTHITDQLNEFLVHKYDLDEKIVVIADGSDDGVIANKIVITLVNLSLDSSKSRAVNMAHRTSISSMKKPPIFLNFFILVSANLTGSEHHESLKFVSDIVTYFWDKPVFNRVNSPTLNGYIDKFVIEFEDTSIKDMHNIYSAADRT